MPKGRIRFLLLECMEILPELVAELSLGVSVK
jgi:hypothetical protein